MALEAVVDNDLLLKTVAWGLFDDVVHVMCEPGCTNSWGALGVARFVIGRLISSVPATAPEVSRRFQAAWEMLEHLEPSDAEARLAAEIEGYGISEGLDLDPGESQLAAIAILRVVPWLLTGDKRAIVALEASQTHLTPVSELAGRVICLEQAIAQVTGRKGAAPTRALVCGHPSLDTSIRISFECGRSADAEIDPMPGLRSYVEDLRRVAPSMLATGPTEIL